MLVTRWVRDVIEGKEAGVREIFCAVYISWKGAMTVMDDHRDPHLKYPSACLVRS